MHEIIGRIAFLSQLFPLMFNTDLRIFVVQQPFTDTSEDSIAILNTVHAVEDRQRLMQHVFLRFLRLFGMMGFVVVIRVLDLHMLNLNDRFNLLIFFLGKLFLWYGNFLGHSICLYSISYPNKCIGN
jgi:hypothetical protein